MEEFQQNISKNFLQLENKKKIIRYNKDFLHKVHFLEIELKL